MVIFFSSAVNFLKNGPKRVFLGSFGKTSPKTRVFSARAPPSKLVYIGAKGPFEIFLGLSPKVNSSKKYKGGPLGQQGVESLRGR